MNEKNTGPDTEMELNTDEDPAGTRAEAGEILSVLWTFLSVFITACIVIAALALVAVKAAGCSLFSIETGSMAPACPVNSVVVIKPYGSFEEIQTGDIITYVIDDAGTTVTHRVVSADAADRTVTTQGDANDTADASPVLYENVVGKVILCIPKIGKIAKAITAKKNRPIVIGIITLFLIWGFLGDAAANAVRRHIAERKKKW